MSLELILKELCAMSDAPKKTIQAACAAAGKRAVGWVAPYGPEELIYAAGCIPVALWGGQVEIKNARTYLPPFACSIMQSIMEYETNGTYDEVLSAVTIPAVCDTLKCFGQKWKGKCPAIPFVHPQNRTLSCAADFLCSEYNLVRKKLEEILNVTITDAAVGEAICLYNDYRSTMRRFTAVAAEHMDVITPAIRHKVIKAAHFADKKAYIPLVTALIDELEKLPKNQFAGKKLVLSGLLFEPASLLDIFKGYGAGVVADDLAQESRQFSCDVPYDPDPVRAMARQWQNRVCTFAYDPRKTRVTRLIQLARAHAADGIVIGLMKFCDPEEYDVPIIMDACREANIPLLVVDIDQQAIGDEQIQTRVQAFLEGMQ